MLIIQYETYGAYIDVVNDIDAARVGLSRLPIVDSTRRINEHGMAGSSKGRRFHSRGGLMLLISR